MDDLDRIIVAVTEQFGETHTMHPPHILIEKGMQIIRAGASFDENLKELHPDHTFLQQDPETRRLAVIASGMAIMFIAGAMYGKERLARLERCKCGSLTEDDLKRLLENL